MALIAKCLLLLYMIVIVRGTSIDQKIQVNIKTHSANGNEGICGKKNGNSLTKIVGGSPTGVNEYPWQVALVNITNIYWVKCGGSLLNSRWVLTAAHCVPSVRWDLVILGSYNINLNDPYVEIIRIRRVVIHPRYRPKPIWDYDFALIELDIILDLKNVAPEIAPVCLPSINPLSQYVNVSSVVTGWGKTSSGGSPSNVLLEATVETMSNSQCDKGKYSGKIFRSMICAAYPGRDSCKGDSGGPLVTEVDGSFILIGVVSWGFGCADPHHPGIYGRVTAAIPWMKQYIT